MEARSASRLAWLAFGAVAAGLAATLAFSVLNATGKTPTPVAEIVASDLFGLAMFSFPLVGALVATRRPDNAIGWLLLAVGAVWMVSGLIENYARYGFVTDPGALPRPDIVAAATSWLWVPGVGLIGTFVILLFPDGRLPSPRWKVFAWICAVALIVPTVFVPFTPRSLPYVTDYAFAPDIANPLGIEALRPLVGAEFVFLPLLPLCIVGSALSLILRFRRSRGQERLQLKWLAAGAAVTAAIYLVAIVPSLVWEREWFVPANPLWLDILQYAALYSFVLIPIAIGVAMLRYRLYDIDVIINRALVYAVLSVALAVVYVGGVIGVGTIVRAVSGQGSNNLAVAASTLAVAALFRPLRGRVQSFIDRRFYRHKYDAEQTLADFSARLRSQVDLDALDAELSGAVARTMQPAHVSLWLRSR